MSSSAVKCELKYEVESTWDPCYLRAKCKELGLESEFHAYQIRLFRSYIGVFCILHTIVTLIHCILISTLSAHKKYIYFDVGIYTGSCLVLILILSINFWKKPIEKHTWIMFVSSALACLSFVCADLTQTLYHHYFHDWQCGSFYDTYIVYMIYLFLPILCIKGAILVGFIVSVMYIFIFVLILSPKINGRESSIGDTSHEIIHYLCINLFGIYFRVVNDMVVRSSFIDRHQFIKEELSLRNAKRQEKLLLNSILPSQFSGLLQKDIINRIILSQQYASTPIRNFNAFRRSMAIQIHSDVSILYADVVNYTHLTTTLTVEKLVTTLHDLYARFDIAAQNYSVQRIKFLGDCYYCVAGLADPDPDHANKAVALGIAMIAHIREVRESQELDINMRIGIHSGSLYAGVIGEAKLQFDVWGPDVTIANVLESTGVPGAVHISAAVLRNLTNRAYPIEMGPEKAKNDPLLQKYGIITYLIQYTSNDVAQVDSLQDINDLMFASPQASKNLTQSLSTVFRQELREEYRKMPIIRFDLKTLYSASNKNISSNPLNKKINWCLTFYDSALEKAYLKQTDYLFKYHMLLAWFIGSSLIYFQILNRSKICIQCFVVDFLLFLSLTALAFIAWYKQICWLRYGKKNIPHSYNRASCAIFRIHEKIQGNLTVRICTYLFVITLNWVLIATIMVSFSIALIKIQIYQKFLLIVKMTCSYAEFILIYIEERIFHYENRDIICFYPWVSTYMIALMIGMSFTFSHIPLLLKTSVALGHVVIYFILIFLQFDFVFHHSTTTDPYFPSEFAHGFLIITTFFVLYLKSRQTEFSKKVNFDWRYELEKKQNDASITNSSIIILLNNILPIHVVDIYINSLSHNELYYESYEMVSVMFAMLTNFELDIKTLRILNEVITQFDVLLLYYKEYYVVEKIKIVNCTYMAACGLDVNFAGATSKPVRAESLDEGKLYGNCQYKIYLVAILLAEKRLSVVSNQDRDEVVFVMASFALDLMQTLASCNKAYNGIIKEHNIIDAMITIGISSGEVMAGIVGASKPHYDIWGDPVNMAARMEMTGLSGHIQVTEESANILKDFGIQCNYRGQTFVKGRGFLPTYFLGIDEDYNFIRVQGSRRPSHSHRSVFISMGSTYT
ncbi:hypothetical protein KR054_005454 [Drosophila jambulina]|nr:hypothetical protein KR054_005454 [Drosophila jambulina]